MSTEPTTITAQESSGTVYTIRQFRMDTMQDDPILISESTSASLDAVYGDTSPSNRLICSFPGGEPNTLEIYYCRTPMHAVAMLAVLYAVEEDDKHAVGIPQALSSYQREQQAEEEQGHG